MKRQLIIILTLILMVGVTLGTYLLVRNHTEKKQEESAQEQADLQLVNVHSSDIIGIALHTPDGDYTASLDESGSWVMENETDFKINTYYLNSIAGTLCTLTATENIGAATAETKAQYALEDPTRITLTTEAETYTICTGKQTATGEYFYVMIEGREDIYLVESDYSDYLQPSKNSIKDIYIQSDKNSPICSISLEKDGEIVYKLHLKEDDTWEMTEPLKTDYVNVNAISSLQTNILQLIVDKFGDENVTEDQYAEYGFDDPAYTFTFEQESGQVTTIYAKEYNPDSTEMVECLQKETGQIFYCAANYISLLQAETESYLSNTICDLNVSTVSDISIFFEGETMEITIDEENGQYTVDDVDVDALGTEAVTALENFYNAITNLEAEELVMDATIPKIQPAISITYALKDGGTEVIELIEKGDSAYYALRNGTYTGFVLNKHQFTGRVAIYELFDRLKEAVGIMD